MSAFGPESGSTGSTPDRGASGSGASSAGPPAPDLPWRLIGECMLCWVRVGRSAQLALPEGVRRIALLPAALVAVQYESSPVGRYCELSVAVFARVGLRVGMCVVHSVVSSVEARSVYRSGWGMPTELGTLVWAAPPLVPGDDGVRRGAAAPQSLSWAERGVVIRAAPVGRFPLPVGLPARSVQRLRDGARVVVPRRLWGFLRLSRVDVTVEPSAAEAVVPLSWLSGSHAGAVLTGMRVVASPARTPTGLWSSLRVAPEPAPPGLAVE